LEALYSIQIQDASHQFRVLIVDLLLEGGGSGVEEMHDTLARLHNQSVRGQRQVLGFLQSLGLDECETGLSNRGNVGEVGEARGLYRYVEDDGVLGELVKVGY
jgi:hypothetical protein